MNKLPFLKSRQPAALRKQVGVSKYGFSEDDEIIENSLNELMEAVHSKDHSKLMQALKALIECIMAKEPGEEDAIDSQEKP